MTDEKKIFFYDDSNGIRQRISWYDSGGGGSVILFVHGLAPASEVWQELQGNLPVQYRFISVDLNGFGSGSDGSDSQFSFAAQAEMLRQFVRHLGLQDLILTAHSIGAAAAVYALADPEIRKCFSKVILCGALGMNRTIPPALENIAGLSARNPLMRQVSGDLSAYLLLSRLYANPDHLTDEMLHRTAAMLRRPGAAAVLAAVARRAYVPDRQDFCNILKEFTMPVLLIWGAADRISPAEEAEEFRRQNSRFQLKILPECGHLPMWECPAKMAEWMDQFIVDAPAPALTGVLVESVRSSKNRLWHLFDNWNFETLGFLLFLKGLQLLRGMGILSAEENGWRKVTGIFMRNEASKFMLGCFRLRYYIGDTPPEGFALAQRELIARLSDFLQHQNPFHWCVVPGILQEGRRRHYFSDLVTAHYGADGRLVRLEPHFDPRHCDFSPLTEEQIRDAIAAVIQAYNALIPFRGRYRAYRMKRSMARYIRSCGSLQYAGRSALKLLVERLMTATCLHFEQLPEDAAGENSHLRLRMPAVKRYRHPGWGLLNIFCRFRHDFSEADLWVQYHHVPVDGAPMQELLQKLKRQWGACGPIEYPALNSPAAHPELIYCGDRLYRARFYVDFSKILQLRRELNQKYSARMEGNATLAGMLLWGLAQHPYFRKRKMLFPVESGTHQRKSGERELGLVFIRPAVFEHSVDPLTGFLRFQKAFNRMIRSAREGNGASDEFLNLASTVHPIFYHLANRLVPEALQEIVGTVGLSIIRDAEMFISPLSDFQSGGFMAVGNVSVPARDGRRLGAVSVCGERRQIRFYIEAVRRMETDYADFFVSSKKLN